MTKSRSAVAALIALVSFGLFVWLAHAVGARPDPPWLMAIEVPLVNHSTLVAWWLTWLCYAYVLVPVCLVLAIVAIRHPAWRSRVTFSVLSLLLSWQGADAFQKAFMRPRRLDWVVKHETAYSFPSSHAAVTVGFYAVLAVFVWQSHIRGGRAFAVMIGVLGCGIIWSRLALAAHYATDLLGGALWAAAVVGALAARWPRNVFEEQSASS